MQLWRCCANCYNTGNIRSSVEGSGGVVGCSYGGVVQNCYNAGAVSDGFKLGGVVGRNGSDGIVRNCYNTGSVNNESQYVGGIVGYNENTVQNCYNTGTEKVLPLVR